MGIIGIGGVAIINNGSANTNPDGDNTPVYFANCATPSALPTCTYNNGTSGVGATLTANANGALTTTYTDAVALSVGLIILVWKQSSALQNGIYEITQIGTVSTPWILTRLAIYDTTAEVYPSQVNILGGNTYANLYFLQQTANPTIGTSSIVYQTATAPTGTTINQNLRLVDTYTSSALPTCTYTPNASATTPALNAYLNASSNGIFPTLNGVAPFQYMKVLVYGQADQTQNGDYILQNVGSASSTWRLSRISYTASALYPAWWGIYSGTGRGLIFEQTTSTLTTATIGVSGNIVFVQVSSSGLTYFTEAQNSSAPNATVYVDSLTAVSASTNADISIVPKGSGAFLLAVPDNTAIGGDKRGAGAVDLQIVRTANSQVASGARSFVAGYANTAVLDDSYAIGVGNSVTSYYGIALGRQNNISGSYAVGLGYSNTSSGQSSTAIGYGNIANTTSATAIGYGNIASGQYSTTIGYGNQSSNNYSISGGYNNISSGAGSVALGMRCTASGQTAIALGGSAVATTTATADYAIAIGYGNVSNAQGAVSIGMSSTASGQRSVALGSGSISSGQYSFSVGYNSTASGLCDISIGYENTASGGVSIAIGRSANTFAKLGRQSFSSGYIATSGDCQISSWIMKTTTTDATPTVVTTSIFSTTPGLSNQIILENNSVYRFKGQIVGKKTGTTEIGVWDVDGVIVRGANAGTTTLTISNVTLVTNASGWGTPTLTADATNGGLKVTVIGLSATSIGWNVSIETTEVIY